MECDPGSQGQQYSCLARGSYRVKSRLFTYSAGHVIVGRPIEVVLGPSHEVVAVDRALGPAGDEELVLGLQLAVVIVAMEPVQRVAGVRWAHLERLECLHPRF